MDHALAIFLGLIVGLPIAGLIIGVILVKSGPAILTKTTLNLAEKAIPFLPERVQRFIEARRPTPVIDGTAISVPNQARRLPSPHTSRTSGPNQGGDPMDSTPAAGRRRAGPGAYNPSTDSPRPQPSRINVSGISEWAKASPVVAVIAGVMLVSLILNPLLLGLAIFREPVLFLWMELLSAIAFGGLAYLSLRLKALEEEHKAVPVIDADFLNAMKKVFGSTEDEMRQTLEGLKASNRIDPIDISILDGIRNTMSSEEWTLFLANLVKAFEKELGSFERNPQPREIYGWSGGFSPRLSGRRFTGDPDSDSPQL